MRSPNVRLLRTLRIFGTISTHMEYAIIQTGGKQYKVTPGMVFEVENLGKDTGTVDFTDVLLYVSGDDMNLGTPFISGFSVNAKIIGAKRGEKIHVSKFKAKSRYRKTIGHRQSLTTVEILSLGGAAKATPKPVVKKTTKKADA